MELYAVRADEESDEETEEESDGESSENDDD